MDIDLSTDTPASPGRTLQLADLIAEAARCLAYDTRHPDALQDPAEAYQAVTVLALGVSRLPQVLRQVAGRLEQLRDNPGIKAEGGGFAGRPDAAVMAARRLADEAGVSLEGAAAVLDEMAQVTSGMAAARG